MNNSINSKVKRHWISRIRFQLLGGLFFATVLPVFFRPYPFLEIFVRDNEFNTLIGAAFAVIFGFIVTRRLSNYPSVNAGSYVIISFSVSYLFTAGMFLMLRLDYSRPLFIISFAFCMLWFVLIYFVAKRVVKAKYAIVPGGNAMELISISYPQWTVLSSPDEYRLAFGAVVVDLRYSHEPQWERFIAECALKGIPVYHTKLLKEALTGKVEIEHLSENTFGSLLPNLIYQRLKLSVDVLLALIVLPLVLILVAVAGLAILITSGGPVFFKQQRTGFRGEPFTVYKLRTMKILPNNEDPTETAGINPSQTVKPENRSRAITQSDDARITPLGSFLRKYRIDELPQIFNILKGEMSWIGPRPEAIELSTWYENELPFYPYRHIVRPGISGWAQVNQGHVAEVEQVGEKLHYDFFYIKNLSAWLDFLIVLKTVRVIFSGYGSK